MNNFDGDVSFFHRKKEIKKEPKPVPVNAFEFIPQGFPEIILIKPNHKFMDDRGWFMESFKKSEFVKAGITEDFVQENISFSKGMVLRGVHYQRDPKAQGKLVEVTQGKIWDFFVDIREGSPTYGHWGSYQLTADNGCQLYIPPGFAHGFIALTYAKVVYKCTNEYSKENDAGFLWSDKKVNIQFPISTEGLIISEKDRKLPTFGDRDRIFI